MNHNNTPREALVSRVGIRVAAALSRAAALVCLVAAGATSSAFADVLAINPPTGGPLSGSGANAPLSVSGGPPSLVNYAGVGTTWMNWAGTRIGYPAKMNPVPVAAHACGGASGTPACAAVTIKLPPNMYWTGRWAYQPFSAGVYLLGNTPTLEKSAGATGTVPEKVVFRLGNINAQRGYAYVWIEVATGPTNLVSVSAAVDPRTGKAQLDSPPWLMFTGRIRVDAGRWQTGPALVSQSSDDKAVTSVTVSATGGTVEAEFAPTERYVLGFPGGGCTEPDTASSFSSWLQIGRCPGVSENDRVWYVSRSFGNVTTLQWGGTGECVESFSNAPATLMRPCTGKDSTRWYLQWSASNPSNEVSIVNAANGYCLQWFGSDVWLRPCDGNPLQRWRLFRKTT